MTRLKTATDTPDVLAELVQFVAGNSASPRRPPVLSMIAAWWVSWWVSTSPMTDRFFAAMLARSALLVRVENT
ncbi:hypothetical protein ACGF7U_08285 [Micromonospora sp. NPDC047670]|uniref:hypothetical protein n=1 Tax=Micromonospora sp. NPDC047670 TaxID=3364252 RepID=UPI0037189B97